MVLGEVDQRLERALRAHQPRAPRVVVARAQGRAAERAPPLRLGLGGQRVAQALDAREVEAPAQEGAAREVAGRGGAKAPQRGCMLRRRSCCRRCGRGRRRGCGIRGCGKLGERIEHAAHDGRPAVHVQLEHVVAGHGARGREEEDEGVAVQHVGRVVAARAAQAAHGGAARRRERGGGAERGVDGAAGGAGDADDGDGGAAGAGREGVDRLIVVAGRGCVVGADRWGEEGVCGRGPQREANGEVFDQEALGADLKLCVKGRSYSQSRCNIPAEHWRLVCSSGQILGKTVLDSILGADQSARRQNPMHWLRSHCPDATLRARSECSSIFHFHDKRATQSIWSIFLIILFLASA